MIVNGKEIAEDIIGSLHKQRAQFVEVPTLGILMSSGDAATQSFVRIKGRIAKRLGVPLIHRELSEHATVKDALQALHSLAEMCNGVIVQLPLPAGIDTEVVLRSIPKTKDVDGINPTIADEERLVISPVAGAIEEVLHRSHIELSGVKTFVVGAGRLVGKPAAFLLHSHGASVEVLTSEHSLEALQNADLIVLGAGVPGLLQPSMIKEGAIVIDAGTSEANGKVAGDADPACASKCSVFTPVPGGIGPIAVAMIFKNLFELSKGK